MPIDKWDAGDSGGTGILTGGGGSTGFGPHGGGGGGGGGSLPTDPNAREFGTILQLLSEGPIAGPINGLHSIKLDGTPVLDVANHPNFKGVAVSLVAGTNTQAMIPGFTDAEAETSVNVKVSISGGAVTRTIATAGISAIRVRIAVPTLKIINATSGAEAGAMVMYQIERQSASYNGGAWETLVLNGEDIIMGKFGAKYTRSVRVETPAAGPWSIRVTRLTPDHVSGAPDYTQDETWWDAYTEITDAKLRYPYSALCALKVDAKQFQQIPKLTMEAKGRIISVPNGYTEASYNSTTGIWTAATYPGIWDGTFIQAWSANPAWIWYDLASHTRYGAGSVLDASKLDKWALYAISQACDVMVSDGKGGTEPRFRCSVYLQSQEDAIKLLQEMASVFRGMAYWAGGLVTAVQDDDEPPVAIFTNSNVKDGKFTYQGSARKGRHTAALVTWMDPQNGYQASVEYIEDQAAITRYGYNPTQVAALGATSQAQARRWGSWTLLTETMDTEVVSLSSGLEGSTIRPGNIIATRDQFRAGDGRLGGRILAGATTTVVPLDGPCTLPAGTNTLTVRMQDGTVQTSTITTAAGVTSSITVSPAFTVAPVALSQWAVNVALYRVLGIKKGSDLYWDITALEHTPSKYALIDGVTVTPGPATPPNVLTPPTSLAMADVVRVEKDKLVQTLTATWSGDATALYAAQASQDYGEWQPMKVNATSASLDGITAGAWRVRAQTIYPAGASAWATGTHTVGTPTQTATDAAAAAAAAAAAQSTANTASANATSALSQLTNIASDNILSAVEKPSVIEDYTVLTTEQAGIDAQADAYSVSRTAYDSAISSLTSYLATLTSPTAWNSVTGDTPIVGTTFRTNWTNAYTAKTALLNAIYAAAKALADAAQGTANMAVTNAATAQTSANNALALAPVIISADHSTITLPSSSYPAGKVVFQTTDNTLWQVNAAGTGWQTPSMQTTALIGTIVAGQIAAGAIGANALAATIAMLGVITSTTYTPGNASSGPVGYKLSGPAFTTTYIGGGTNAACHFELEGTANFGGYQVATVLNNIAGAAGTANWGSVTGAAAQASPSGGWSTPATFASSVSMGALTATSGQFNGSFRVDTSAITTSFIGTGTGSNFQVYHDGSSNVQLVNSGNGGFSFTDGLGGSLTSVSMGALTAATGAFSGVVTVDSGATSHIRIGNNTGGGYFAQNCSLGWQDVLTVSRGGLYKWSLQDNGSGTAAVFTSGLTVNGALSATTGTFSDNVTAPGFIPTSTTLDLSSLDQATWYPVTFSVNPARRTRFRIKVALDSGTVPTWSTHPSGFSVICDWTCNGYGWGTSGIQRTIHSYEYSWSTVSPVGGLDQMNNSSLEVVYLRGGGKYFFESDYLAITPTIQTATYTINSQTVSPTTAIINNVFSAATSSVGIGALSATSGTFSSAVSMGALTATSASIAAGGGIAIADGAPGVVTNKLYNSTSQLMWNGWMVLTLGNISTNAAVYQAAMASATAPMTGTHAQMVAYSTAGVPSGYLPYWYATDDLNTNDSTYGALYQWNGSAWVYVNQPQAFFPKVTAGVISAGAVGTNALATGSITAASGIIANLAVGTAQIQDAAITTAKIGLLQVTNAQIADATIASAKIAALDAGKITTGTLDTARLSFTPIGTANVVATINSSSEGITVNAAKLNLTGVLAVGGAGADINSGSTTISGSKITTGTITATQLTTDLAITNVVRSSAYTAGTGSAAPSGFKMSGNTFTSYFLDGSNAAANMELGGIINLQGYRLDYMATRTMTKYNRILNGSFYWDKTGWTDNNGTFPFTWLSTGYDTGSGCIGMVTTATGVIQASRVSQPFNSPPTSNTVTLSLWAKVDASMSTASVTAILYNTSTGTSTTVINAVSVVTYTSWTQITADITSLVSGGGDFVLQIFTNGNAATIGQTVYIDNIKIII